MRYVLASLAALAFVASVAAEETISVPQYGPFLGVEYTVSATGGTGTTATPALMLGLESPITVSDRIFAVKGWVSKWVPYQLHGWWGFGVSGNTPLTPWFPHLAVGGGVRLGLYWDGFSFSQGYWTPFVETSWYWSHFNLGLSLWLPFVRETAPLGGPYITFFMKITF